MEFPAEQVVYAGYKNIDVLKIKYAGKIICLYVAIFTFVNTDDEYCIYNKYDGTVGNDSSKIIDQLRERNDGEKGAQIAAPCQESADNANADMVKIVNIHKEQCRQ